MFAVDGTSFALGPDVLGMLGVPGSTFGAPVPLSGRLQRLSTRRTVGPVIVVVRVVILGRKRSQVRWVVVARVPIDVVDVPARWDRPVVRHVDLPVERLLTEPTGGPEVLAVAPPL